MQFVGRMIKSRKSSLVSANEVSKMRLCSSCISFFSLHSFDKSHGDHGFPFTSRWSTTFENPHNEVLRVPFMIYNPNIKNPEKRKIVGNFYSLSIPTTILDLMIHTKSFAQSAQQTLARRFAEGYEHAQSFLRPVKETIRFFFVHPGGTQWVLDNGRNLRVRFPLCLLIEVCIQSER